jgi:adenylate cyclase
VEETTGEQPQETTEDALAAVRAVLLARGVSDEEIATALAEDRLDLLAIDHLMMRSPRRLTLKEIAAESDVDNEEAARLWSALGFPQVGEDEPYFTEDDLHALGLVHGLVSLGIRDLDTTVQLTRVMGLSMARLAEAVVAATAAAASDDGSPTPRPATGEDHITIAENVAFASELVLPGMEQLIIYGWRRHIQAATRRYATMRRELASESSTAGALTIGFADMVGFTALSQQLDAHELARVVDRFESVAHVTVVGNGGRIVKMIGDEVMYVSDEPRRGVEIALALVEAYSDDDLLSDVRVGLATGPVLAREGDYFGTPVNRASRLVNIADAGMVLGGRDVHDAVGDSPDIVSTRLGSRTLKDLGRVEIFAVKRRGTPEPTEARRHGVRLRILSQLLRDLEVIPRLNE